MKRWLNFKIVSKLVGILLLFFLWTCEENPVNLPLSNATLVTDTLYATFDSTYKVSKTITTLGSERLLVGSYAGFTFRTIIRFSGLPTNVTIDSAWIEFSTVGAIGDLSSNFTVTGYPIINAWLADTSDVWQDYNANVDFSNPLGEILITPETDDTLYFHFNDFGMQRLNEWADTSTGIDNNGIALDFTSASFVKAFQARNSSQNIGPFLFIQYRDSTQNLITDSLLSISDAFLFEGNFSPLPERNLVTTLDTWATVLQFDVQSLKQKYPEGVIVETARLEMAFDPDNTIIDPDFGAKMNILPLKSEPRDSNVVIDSSFIGVSTRTIEFSQFNDDSTLVVVKSGNDRQALARLYIQNMLSSEEPYTGFYVEFAQPEQFLSKFAFYRYNQQELDKRPRLIIQSLRLPPERL